MDTFLSQLQMLYEFSMAIGTSLDLRVMLRKSVSTILRKLNCQAGGVLFKKELSDDTFCFEQVFSIPRGTKRIEEYQKVLMTFPETFNNKWCSDFIDTLPRHIDVDEKKHIYIFELPDIGIFLLLKNDLPLNPILVKSLTPLCAKLATACRGCLQNSELLEHRDNLASAVEQKTDKIVTQNFQLMMQIKEKKLAEIELRESEERYAAVVKQAIEGIYLLDPETKLVLDSNTSFQQMLGYTADELQNLQVYDFAARSRDEIDASINSTPRNDETVKGERKYRDSKGKLIDVEVSAKQIKFSGRWAILVIVRDTSEKKLEEKEKEKLKEQLRQAQKFEALGTLAGGVAHDLNNILSGIIGYPDLLLNTLPANSELRKPLAAIHDSGKRASTIVADLLTMARSAASKREVYNINALIREYFYSPEFKKTESEYSGITYVQKLNAESPYLLCSSVHIKKCLMNLVINGVESIEKNGDISVTTTNQFIDQSDPDYADFNTGLYIVMDVCDTGKGISKKDLEHIFEPFYTRKELGRSGTGLGLTVVYNTVIDHAGRIKLTSNQDGSSFKLFFPHYNESETSQPLQDPDEHVANKEGRILIVDDEPMLRDLASQMLKVLGYSAQAVPSGEAAIQFIKEHQVDLMIVDMLMEPGINGRQTYEEIIKICPGIKAIIASGFSETNDVKEALRLGANGFIQKPYSMIQLGKAIMEAMQS